MEFIDWRKSPDKARREAQNTRASAGRLRGSQYYDYIEEQIHAAQERGDFDNLPGAGKPLNLEDESVAGDKALAYHLLKSNDCVPAEIELANEIRAIRERIEAKLSKIVHQGKTLRARRVPPFPSEKRAFNVAVERAAVEYDQTLRELNRKILTLNLTVPAAMHQPFVEVERLVQNFREACPLFEDKAG